MIKAMILSVGVDAWFLFVLFIWQNDFNIFQL